MSYLLKELRAAETEELVARHDAAAENTSVDVNYYLDELAARGARAGRANGQAQRENGHAQC